MGFERVAKEHALAALAEAIAAYEEAFGEISAQELVHQALTDRESAIVVRGAHKPGKPKAPGKKTK